MATFYQLFWIIVLLQCTSRFANQQTSFTPKTTRTTLAFHEFEMAKKMKKMKYEYFPNYGYEPYWANGEWVLSTTVDPLFLAGKTTTKRPTVCGEECSYLIRRIREVCGRQSGDTAYSPGACHQSYTRSCDGYPGDNYDSGFRTFKTYCAFLDAQCHAKFYNKTRWVLVNLGKCKPLDIYFRPLWVEKQLISRMEFFLSSLGSE